MMCKHEFTGHENGVTCNKCGLNLSIAEYRDFLDGKVEEVPKQAETVEAEKPKKRTTTKKGA